MKQKLTTFERLAERIKKDLDIDAKEFRRTGSGYLQKKAGAMAWNAVIGCNQIGTLYISSKIPARSLIKCKRKLFLYSSQFGDQNQLYIK